MPAQPLPIGKVFGKLKIIDVASPHPKTGLKRSICQCECGTTKTIINRYLVIGHTKSCGCLLREITRARSLVHGHQVNGGKSRTLLCWKNMMLRCYDPKSPRYHTYGGRGITVCDKWKEFRNFLEDMGEKPIGLSLDREDNNLGYSKENCRWATAKQQARNKTTNNILTVRGVTACVVELCEIFGVKYVNVRQRLHNGWSYEDAFFNPPMKNQWG